MLEVGLFSELYFILSVMFTKDCSNIFHWASLARIFELKKFATLNLTSDNKNLSPIRFQIISFKWEWNRYSISFFWRKVLEFIAKLYLDRCWITKASFKIHISQILKMRRQNLSRKNFLKLMEVTRHANFNPESQRIAQKMNSIVSGNAILKLMLSKSCDLKMFASPTLMGFAKWVYKNSLLSKTPFRQKLPSWT